MRASAFVYRVSGAYTRFLEDRKAEERVVFTRLVFLDNPWCRGLCELVVENVLGSREGVSPADLAAQHAFEIKGVEQVDYGSGVVALTEIAGRAADAADGPL